MEISQQELDFLVDFLQNNLFNEWINIKKKISCVIQKAGQFLEDLIQYLFKTSHLIGEIYNLYTFQKKEEKIKTLEGFQQFNNQLVKTQFHLITQINRDKIYKKDGQILRVEKYILGSKNEQILLNLEQMKYLEFKGQYGINGYKCQQWNYYWKGKQVGGGLYNNFGQKEGKWIDLCENYWDRRNITEAGDYFEDKRIGDWKMYWNNQKMYGGGEYDKQGTGQKIGRWVELSEHYCDNFELTYHGEYKNGKKFGRWDICYNNGNGDQIMQQIFYKGRKQNFQCDRFHRDSYVTYQGEYLNGQRVGKWDIWFKEDGDNKQNIKIGGGSYDEQGAGTKTGQWIEISDSFKQDSKVTYKGEYQNGRKFGRWDIYYNNGNDDQIIGGGQYEEGGDNIKIGQWIEISDAFKQDSKVSQKGEYKDGRKFGRWDIFNNDQLIGGGQYDERGDGIKEGKWIDIREGFKDGSKVTYKGEYKNGRKFGRWDIYYNNENGDQIIGGGQYEEGGDNIKIGQWIDISDRFHRECQVTYKGEYLNGYRVGKWDIWFKEDGENKQNIKIGGGSYDQQRAGMKIGQWIEISDVFKQDSKVSQKGEYKDGRKFGRWDIYYNNENGDQIMQKVQYIEPTFKLVSGGGRYEEGSDNIKIGNWIDISDGFCRECQVTYKGEYKIGKRVGKWDILYKDLAGNNESIGGGFYDERGDGMQIGKWIDLDDGFCDSKQITYKGQYKNGKKQGLWVEIDIEKNKQCSEIKYHNYYQYHN
ncbi:unnamed protein product [Paramecium primaurelia]|uniref:Uncharacterized protein n=1 Tax=Paramecium primaurelia TaxID=5886 RepID=A0A8S1PE74_PARPR|nr:unnamed protein product [Paramecium primaurelia]